MFNPWNLISERSSPLGCDFRFKSALADQIYVRATGGGRRTGEFLDGLGLLTRLFVAGVRRRYFNRGFTDDCAVPSLEFGRQCSRTWPLARRHFAGATEVKPAKHPDRREIS
jgi:hypothetical protein